MLCKHRRLNLSIQTTEEAFQRQSALCWIQQKVQLHVLWANRVTVLIFYWLLLNIPSARYSPATAWSMLCSKCFPFSILTSCEANHMDTPLVIQSFRGTKAGPLLPAFISQLSEKWSPQWQGLESPVLRTGIRRENTKATLVGIRAGRYEVLSTKSFQTRPLLAQPWLIHKSWCELSFNDYLFLLLISRVCFMLQNTSLNKLCLFGLLSQAHTPSHRGHFLGCEMAASSRHWAVQALTTKTEAGDQRRVLCW